MVLLSILLAAAAGFATGAVWYGVLSKRWLAATGRTEEEIKADRSPLPFILAGITALLASTVLRHVFDAVGLTFGGAVTAGIGIGLGLVAPWIVLNHAFAGRPRDLWWIDAGYAALAVTVISIVHGFFL
ncbi:MAG: DUF1761 domain-containing protein [Pseudomonadota bacterium]